MSSPGVEKIEPNKHPQEEIFRGCTTSQLWFLWVNINSSPQAMREQNRSATSCKLRTGNVQTFFLKETVLQYKRKREDVDTGKEAIL